MAAKLPRALYPFRTPQYRILAAALIVSLLGAGTWIVALVFQVRDLGGTPTDLSFVAALNAVGLLASVLVAGVVADRVPQKWILLAVEVTKAVCFGIAAFLGLTGIVEVWHLAVLSLVLGIVDGFFYPAYSALLPSILPAEELLPANGIEGMLRPTVHQALGPLLASAVIAAASPAAAFLVVAVLQLLAGAGLLWLRTTPVRREVTAATGRHPLLTMVDDIREGVRYMVRTPWFFGTLLYACLWVLVMLGPIEVLLPFAVTDQTGGGAGSYALVLAAFGIGGALSSLAVASFRLPRRYLSVMNLVWGFGTLPLIVVGVTNQLWVMIVAVFVVGAALSWGQVIWGTLLQRRVPPEMLGRVSSLDFFVSLALMPISMALAGPVGEAVGFGWTFLVAGLVPIVLAVVVLAVFKMRQDEIAHPLDDRPPADEAPPSSDEAPPSSGG
jgi:MFS family permease